MGIVGYIKDCADPYYLVHCSEEYFLNLVLIFVRRRRCSGSHTTRRSLCHLKRSAADAQPATLFFFPLNLHARRRNIKTLSIAWEYDGIVPEAD